MHCRRCNSRAPLRRQRGAALIVAMLVFAICTALIVAMKSEFTLFYQRGANLFLAEQSQAYLRGAEDLAALALVVDFDLDQASEAPRDDLQETWAQEATYPLEEGGWLSGNLQDLQGRFNLNALVGAAAAAGEDDGAGLPGKRFTPSQQQFIRLLQTLREPQLSQQQAIEVTESIGDWLDSDSRVSEGGAEDDYYYSRTPPHRAANQPMASVSELRAVANVTPELYCALLPLVTVWPRQAGLLNIFTAPEALLRTINSQGELSPLSEGDGQAMVAQREEPGYRDLAEFLEQPVLAGLELGELQSLLGGVSDWFLLSATVEVADRSTRLYSVLRRNQRNIEVMGRYGAVADPICARMARPDPDDDAEGENDGRG